MITGWPGSVPQGKDDGGLGWAMVVGWRCWFFPGLPASLGVGVCGKPGPVWPGAALSLGQGPACIWGVDDERGPLLMPGVTILFLSLHLQHRK